MSLTFIFLTFRVLTKTSAFAETHSIVKPLPELHTCRSDRRRDSLSERLSAVDLDCLVSRAGRNSGGEGTTQRILGSGSV